MSSLHTFCAFANYVAHRSRDAEVSLPSSSPSAEDIAAPLDASKSSSQESKVGTGQPVSGYVPKAMLDPSNAKAVEEAILRSI